MPRSNRSISVGHLRKQRIERLVEDFQPRHFGVAQIDHDAGAVGGLDPRLPKRIAQPDGRGSARSIASGICAL